MGIVNKLSNSISAFNRERKYTYFLQKISPEATSTILDVGFSSYDYSASINYLEKHYPYPQNITALGLENECKDGNFQNSFPEVNVVLYNGTIFPFEDKLFDIGWSNAVIEHVGKRDKQIFFLKEFLRTCKTVYFTTPNKMFPFELHTRVPLLHWLPKKYFDAYLKFIGKKWATGDYMYLLSKKDIYSICKDAGATSIEIKKNKFFGFTMDFSIIVK